MLPVGGIKGHVQIGGDSGTDCEYTRGTTYPRWPGVTAGVPVMNRKTWKGGCQGQFVYHAATTTCATTIDGK